MTNWRHLLKSNPLPWLLEEETPAVRHLAPRQILDQPADVPEVRQARAAAMRVSPIVDILAAQQPQGYWVKPGPGYSPKYRGTVWQLIFLDQLGADGTDARVRAACEYVLSHSQTETGGFAASGQEPPLPRHMSSIASMATCCGRCSVLAFWRMSVYSARLTGRRARSPVRASATGIAREPVDRVSAAQRTSNCPALGERSKPCWPWPVSLPSGAQHTSSAPSNRE